MPELLFALVLLAAGLAALSLLNGAYRASRLPVALLAWAGAAFLVLQSLLGTTSGWLSMGAAISAGAALLVLVLANRRRDRRDAPQPAALVSSLIADNGMQEELAETGRELGELKTANRSLEDLVSERTKELVETTRRFETALAGSDVTMFQQNPDLCYTWVYNPLPGLENMVGHTDEGIFPPETAAQLASLKNGVLATGKPAEDEISFPSPTGPRWFKLRVEPLDYARKVGITSVAVDITAAKESEAHLRSLLRELTHRSRNLLAVIQGIARRTAASADSVDAFVDRFGARLQALASAHDILVDSSWKGASMREIVDVQLAHVGEAGDRQVSVEGKPITLRPDAAQHLSLALHELAVNALQHGALSDPAGRVSLSWRGPDETHTDFELIWREDGGPKVGEPSAGGFGRVVLDRLVPRGMDGEATLDFDPAGVVWKLRFPESNVLTEATSGH